MAFYKARLQKKSGLYYPQAITVGKQISTKQLGMALSDRSTVTLSDTLAVLSELGVVMSTFMAQGRSVHLDGLGSFRYTINAQKQGVATAEEVSADQIKSIRVRFVPEVTRNADKTVATRSMQPSAVEWTPWGGKVDEASVDTGGGGSTDSGGNDDGSSPL